MNITNNSNFKKPLCRSSFINQIRKAILSSKQNNQMVVLLFIDINRFRSINEAFGYTHGDLVLNAVTNGLVCTLTNEAAICKIWSDEYAVLLSNINSIDHALDYVEKINQFFKKPIIVKDIEHHLSFRTGIAVWPNDCSNAEELIHHAAKAMHQAKKHKLNYSLYNLSITNKIYEDMELEADLHKALANNEFYLTYQPQIDIRTMETIGCEALVRWHSPLRGMVPPGRFIPLAEETGQILEIDNWVLRTACQQNQEWKRKGYMPLKVSVNISMYHFKQKDIVKNISAVLKRTGLTPRLLELEVTERVTTDIEHAFSVINELKQLGVSISIDDFGIEYSSLSYLKKLPIDKIKIDSSFVKGMLDCRKDTAIVSSIITLAHNLELKVIAEGVEDGQQLSMLKNLGCDQIQGYLISKPIVSNYFQKKFLKKPS